MRRVKMSQPKVVKDNEVSPFVMFDVHPQGEAHIGESDHLHLVKLCEKVRTRLTPPLAMSMRPHRVGMRNCLSLHLSNNIGVTLDLLITLTGNTVWPDDNEYAKGTRWYVNLTDATDMMWFLKTLELMTFQEE
ncbi:MAG: hypothetical protein P4L95_02380 [Rouxiella aceris]|nr:hypothetical protein [Rouxiella aceris]